MSFETGVQHGFENAFENDCGWFVSRKVAFCKPVSNWGDEGRVN